VVVLAACGGGGTSAKTLVKATDTTLSSGTLDASYDAKLVQDGGRSVTFLGSGVVDSTQHRSAVTVDLASLAAQAGASGSAALFRGHEVVDSSGQVVIYVRVPFYSRRLPAGKPWVRIDYGKTIHEQGISVGLLTLNQDPGQYLEFLRGASGKVKKVGEETVRGVPTTHYSGTIALFDYPQTLTGERKTAAEQQADRIVQLTQTSSFPTDVWVDSDDRVRQMTFEYTIPASATNTAADYTVRLRYSGFGRPPHVALPPPSRVATLSQLKTS
jgi:hypothetical protein